MNRRNFIKLSIVAIGGIALTSYLIRFNYVIRKILVDDTGNLLKDINDIDRFIVDSTKEGYWNTFSISKKVFISAHYYSQLLGIKLQKYQKYRQLRNKITGQFLISTTLFSSNKPWNDKNIIYVGFYNPYKQACSNPFSSLHYS